MHSAAEAGDEGAVYNIGTAARKSGLSVTTIRTWEDRYGAVVPVRDASGRRLYSNEQITQLTWLRQQIDAGLRASEAHRLLMAGEVEETSGGAVVDRGSAWATLLGWIDQEAEWIRSVLADLRRGLGADATAAGVVIDNPLSGPVLNLASRDPAVSEDETDPLAPIAVLSAGEVPGLSAALGKGEVLTTPGSDVGMSYEKVAFAPISLSDSTAGVLVAADPIGDPSMLMARAARVIESRIEADRARSAFSNLLD